ncbi:hypothetical protein F441_20210, partial [Phytophthora nicotianae CJ01A1]
EREREREMLAGTPLSRLNKDQELMIAKWSDILRPCFGQARLDLGTRLVRRKMKEQLATAFCEATSFMVSLITVYESRSFNHSWITTTVMILNATNEEAAKSEFSQELEPLIQSWNDLVRYCDRCYPNWFGGISEMIKRIERAMSS